MHLCLDLALAFFEASDDEETRHLRYDGDCDNYDNISAAYKKSFNEQVEIVAKSLVETRAADTKEQEQIFNQTILEKFGKNREAKRNYYSNQLNYLLHHFLQQHISYTFLVKFLLLLNNFYQLNLP